MEKILKHVLISNKKQEQLNDFSKEMRYFFVDLIRNGISVHFIEEESLSTYMDKNQICKEQALAIGSFDSFLDAAKELNLPVIAFIEPKHENQSYKAAMMIVEGFDELDASFANRMYQRKHSLPWEIARTKRTIIREISLADVADLFLLYQKKGVADYIEPLKPYEEEVEYTKAYINHQYWFYGYGMWLIFDKNTKNLIGRAGLDNREVDGEILLEMGYVIDSDLWRMGYAKEVCEAIIKYATECLDFPTIHCFVRNENTASIGLMQKLSFSYANEVIIDDVKHLHFEKKLLK